MPLKIPSDAHTQHIAFIGKTGSGKTYAAKGMVEGLLNEGRRVVIIDPTGVWWGLRSSANGKNNGFPVVVFGGDYADIDVSPDQGQSLGELIAQDDFSCIVDISEMGITERKNFCEKLLSALYKNNKRAMHLILDEADELAPQSPMPGERVLLNRVDTIVRRGRVKGFRLTMITQRPAVIHKNVLSQIGTMAVLRITSPQDKKAIKGWIEGQGDIVHEKEVISALPKLAVGHGFVWFPSEDYLKQGKFPKIKTFDSSATPDYDDEISRPSTITSVDINRLVTFLEKTSTAEPNVKTPATKTKQPRVDIEAMTQSAFQKGLEEGEVLGYNRGFKEATRQMKASLADLSPKETGIVSIPKKIIPTKTVSQNSSEEIGPERRPLNTLASLYPEGFTDIQWATLTGMKRSGTWSTYKSRLNAAGYIEKQGDIYYATKAGLKILGKNIPSPKTPQEVIQMWKQALGSKPGQILDVLIDEHPNPLHRDALAEAVGLSSTSGTYSTYLSRLSGNGLISRQSKGFLRASDILFHKATL